MRRACPRIGSRFAASSSATRRPRNPSRLPENRRRSSRRIARSSRRRPAPSPSSSFPDKAPEHVRNFLRLAAAGVYDGTSFHRVVRGFVIQTGSVTTRGALTEKQQKMVRTLPPEFNETKHVKGILSMARGDDPASASTSFFIVTGDAPSLDNKYTVFGRVVDGLPVVDAIEQAPVNGETPVSRVDLKAARIIK